MWISYVALVLFCIMIASPAWVFKQIDKLLYSENQADEQMNYIHPSSVVRTISNDDQLDREINTLAKFDTLIQNTKNVDALRIWTNKKQHYLNDLRWRRLEEISHGTHSKFTR